MKLYPKQKKDVPITFRTTKERAKRLKELAKKHDSSQTGMLEAMIDSHFEQDYK